MSLDTDIFISATAIQDVEKVWEALCSKSKNEYKTALGANRRVNQPRGRLIGEHKNLGLILRLICLQTWLGSNQKQFFATALSFYTPSSNNEKLPKTVSRERMLRLTSDEGTNKLHPAFKDGITAWVNNKIRKNNSTAALPVLDAKQIFDDQYCGSSAIEQFSRFILKPEFINQPLSNLVVEQCLDSATAGRVITELEQRENQDSDRGLNPVFLNVVCKGAWCASSALALRLSQHYSQHEPAQAVLILPVSRQGQQPTMAESQYAYHGLDCTHLVELILRFYESGNPYHVATNTIDRESLSVSEVIHTIQKWMAKRPLTIIFDGISMSQRHKTPLERVIADDDIFWLLSRLTDVPVCSSDNQNLYSNFQKNKFILLTDEAITDDFYRKTQLCVTQADAVHLPISDSPLKVESLKSLQLNNYETITSLARQHSALASINSDCVFRLLDVLIPVFKKCDIDLNTNLDAAFFRKPSRYTTDEQWLINRCVQELIDGLSLIDESYTTLLELIACIPDGLRPSTAERFALRIQALQSSTDGTLVSLTREHFDNTLRDFLLIVEPIVHQSGRDSFIGINEDRLTMLSHSVPTTDYRGPISKELESSAIQFRMPQIMQAIQNQMAKNRNLRYHLTHRLLAEEAVVQQTTALTTVDVNTSPTIRSWRRLLSAIYHGLLSLPIQKGTTGYSEIDTDAYDTSSISLHGDGIKFWRWIYFFWYRRMLERPPAWNLSRTYGLDGLKAELLEGFDKPWLLWPIALRQQLGFNDEDFIVNGLFTKEEMNEQDIQHFISHRRSLVRSLIALSDTGSANLALDEIQAQVKKHSGNTSEIFTMSENSKRIVDITINKQHFDIALLQVDDSINTVFKDIFNETLPTICSDLSTYLDIRSNNLLNHINGKEMSEQNQRDQKTRESLADKVIEYCTDLDWKPGEIASLNDIAFRLGERHGIAAEIYGRNSGICRQLNTESLVPPSKEQSFHRTSGLISAYAIHELAETIRLQLFQRFPTSDDYFASGHSGRQMIRTSIALENIQRDRRKSGEYSLSMFGQHAIRSTNTLTRHLFRYPRERASLNIIEASLFRTLGGLETDLQNLHMASKLVSLAEPVVLGLGRTTRIRFRLALERAKINQAIALTTHSESIWNKQAIQSYMLLAKHDLDYLKINAKLPFWDALYNRQQERWNHSAELMGTI